jgi:hypothetical protein
VRVSEEFSELGSGVEKAAISRELYSRGGAALIGWLNLGADGFRELAKRAEEAGVVISKKDVDAVKQLKLEVQALKDQKDALDITIGRSTVGWEAQIEALKGGFKQYVMTGAGGWTGDPGAAALVNAIRIMKQAHDTAELLKKTGTGTLGAPAINEAAGSFRTLSNMLESVRTRAESAGSEEARVAAEARHMSVEMQQAAEELAKLQSEHKIKPETYQREMAALAQMPGMIQQFQAAELGKIEKQRTETVVAARLDLQSRLASLQEKTRENELAAWDREMDELKQRLNKQHKWVPQDEELFGKVRLAGQAKINREYNEAAVEAEKDLQSRLAGLKEKSRENDRIEWDREMDALEEKLKRDKTWTTNAERLLGELRIAGRKRVDREYNEAALAAERDLQSQLLGFEKQTLSQQHAVWAIRVQALREQYKNNEGGLKKVGAIERAGHQKIDRDADEHFRQQWTSLHAHLENMLAERKSAADRLRVQYDQDLDAYSDEELARQSLGIAPEEQDSLGEQFISNREALLQRYGFALVALQNSQGWQGVFGDTFGQAIRGNEELLRQWSESADQAMLMVDVAGEALGEGAQRWFGSFSQGMGQSIGQAIVYKKSVGEAMREALASTLASIAAESITWSIYATALGFIRLAQHQYQAAGQAFTAAAIFGTVGAAAAVAGRAVAPASSNSTGGGEAAASGTSSGSSVGTETATPQPQVAIYVGTMYGGPAGIDELASAINDAVQNRDVRLVATQTRQATRVIR